MKAVLKVSGLLFAFLIVLCISVNGLPIFDHIYGVISPATKYAQTAIEEFFSRSVANTHAYSRKLFDNSVPRVNDNVKSKLSATLKAAAAEPHEKISDQEKEQLNDLIKNHHK